MSDKIRRKNRLNFKFNDKHIHYIRKCNTHTYNIAEGSIRAGKTIDHVYDFAHQLKSTPDKYHLVSASTVGQAKLVIGESNGLGLAHIFRGQCRWTKYRDNEALLINGPDTKFVDKIVIFAGGGKADSYKSIRGNSFGMWLATEINLHHETFIKEALNRTIAALNRKIYWDLNPDSPNHPVYIEHIDKYIQRGREGKMSVNYEHFLLHDNPILDPKKIDEIVAGYTPGTVWFKRDIQGLRVAAEGLIHEYFANHKDELMYKDKILPMWVNIVIGIDYGGNGSKNSITVTGIRNNYTGVDILRSDRFEPHTTNHMAKQLIDVINWTINKFGFVSIIYADSAETILNKSIAEILVKNDLGYIPFKNALKIRIKDRISLTDYLLVNHAISYSSDTNKKGILYCDSWVKAMETCVWDPNELVDDVRLDNGTSDIDSMDSYEYTIERYRKLLIQNIKLRPFEKYKEEVV